MPEQLTSDKCDWMRLPDDVSSPLRLDKVRFLVGCNGETVSGVHPFYPDDCPRCGKPVRCSK